MFEIRSHLFEWMDTPGIPESLRHTLTDILEIGNTYFRFYNYWVAEEVKHHLRFHPTNNVFELGCGAAPVTRMLAQDSEFQDIKLVPCDANPDEQAFQALSIQHLNQVHPCYEPLNYSKIIEFPPSSIAVLSATFHHLPREERKAVIQRLAESAEAILVFEPLRCNVLSLIYCLLGLISGLLSPLFLNRPGRLRRILWCWLLPVAPFLFVWDGMVSALRMWRESEWLSNVPGCEVESTLFCQKIVIRRGRR